MARRRSFHRTDRLNRQIQQILAVALQMETREEILRQVIITAVEVTRDLSLARVHYFPMSGEPEAAVLGELEEAFERARGFLRTRVGQELRLRHTPELRFHLDTGITSGRRVEEILQELDLPPASEAQEDDEP